MALIQCQYFSNVLGLSCSMNVILPQRTMRQIGMQGQADNSQQFHGHPTLYLLHGLSDDHSIWLRRTSIERYVAPLGLAVVMPAVDRSFYTDMARGPRYWTFLSEELPALARSFFPLSARREDNFVAGLSMGGYGALKLAMRCPDRFAAGASLSGALNAVGRIPRAEDEDWVREMVTIFGEFKDAQGGDDDLFAVAEKLAASEQPRPRLYACCGTEDFLWQHHLDFKQHAAGLGLDLTAEEDEGHAHDWAYWDLKIRRVLQWLGLPGPVGK